jgi:8-oxo-dGTP pyrophosphatase MutT (NUDIX family)
MPDLIRQAAALPIRDGQICLITSRRRNRWVLPKGHVEDGHTFPQTAVTEAWEEAGLIGEVRKEPAGTFRYKKLNREYEVTVFVFDVTMVTDVWPESSERQREWMSVLEAMQRVEEIGLRSILSEATVIGGALGPPLLKPHFSATR